MFICELYQSIQGEGRLTGTESVFVRTSGCNLRCGFCDTPFSSWHPEGKHQSVEEIVQQVKSHTAKHVVITGGEPMIQKDLPELTEAIHALDRHITIETAGTLAANVKCDLMSVSPKLSNSTPSSERSGEWREKHEKTRHRPEVIRHLVSNYEYQIKFVVDYQSDLDEIREYLSEFPEIDAERVLLMPQGIEEDKLAEKEQWMTEACAEFGFRFCPRMHIVWFGNRRGT